MGRVANVKRGGSRTRRRTRKQREAHRELRSRKLGGSGRSEDRRGATRGHGYAPQSQEKEKNEEQTKSHFNFKKEARIFACSRLGKTSARRLTQHSTGSLTPEKVSSATCRNMSIL